MPLTSFAEVPQAVVPEHKFAFRLGTPNVTEAVEVANQAMYELDLAGPDRDKNLDELTNDFTKLTQAGYDGRLHVLPSQAVTFEHILAAAEGRRPESVQPVTVYRNLWTSGTEQYSCTAEELNAGPASHVARLAVFSNLETGYDPVLHDLGKPYDSYKDKRIDVNPDHAPTQLEELEVDIAAFEAQRGSYTLDSLDQKAFAVLALMDRIRGVKSEDQILSRGLIRIAKLGRGTVGGDSAVGRVDSSVGQLRFVGSDGYARLSDGVGRSMGLDEA
mgnify:CR=1 FL=1